MKIEFQEGGATTMAGKSVVVLNLKSLFPLKNRATGEKKDSNQILPTDFSKVNRRSVS